MSRVPLQVRHDFFSDELARYLGPPLLGKVRNTYELPGHPHHLLLVATDRVSIFDFVLGFTIPKKGEVLTAMTVMWLKFVLPSTHVADHLPFDGYGSMIDKYLPRKLQGNQELQRRALVVHLLNMQPVECIVRKCLTGSGWSDYQRTGEVCGHKLPEGLFDGNMLPNALFTPSTKAQYGHDENIDAANVVADYPRIDEKSILLFYTGYEYSASRGIIIADTKFEFGVRRGGSHPELVLGDEVLTPDSSRFWLKSEWLNAQAEGRSPSGYDKQALRDFGKKVRFDDEGKEIVGIHKLDPHNERHVDLAARAHFPQQVIDQVQDAYLQIFQMLEREGRSLQKFQEQVMRIRA